ncbi:hypothetical protein L798_06893 [Zootermopsis nevadensis]|uniref:Uncharacterized protein n=1 Tax=Zootermopsis nevadensis TaxID=136037 RepID=A0A067QS04_ZOONE|nr:hypothetical protein L798_06893 [Zootermopsis nevadensis]
MVVVSSFWRYETHHMWRELLIIVTEGNDETLAGFACHGHLQLKRKDLLCISVAQMYLNCYCPTGAVSKTELCDYVNRNPKNIIKQEINLGSIENSLVDIGTFL